MTLVVIPADPPVAGLEGQCGTGKHETSQHPMPGGDQVPQLPTSMPHRALWMPILQETRGKVRVGFRVDQPHRQS